MTMSMFDTAPELDADAEAVLREAQRAVTNEAGTQPSVKRLFDDPYTTVIDGLSEPYLRDDEVVCPVTNYTYYYRLPRSPYLDDKGGRIF